MHHSLDGYRVYIPSLHLGPWLCKSLPTTTLYTIPNFQLSTPNTATLVPLACQLTHLLSIAPSTPQQSPPVLSKLVGYTPTSYSAHLPLKTGKTTHTQPISSSVAPKLFVLCSECTGEEGGIELRNDDALGKAAQGGAKYEEGRSIIYWACAFV